MFLFLFPPLYHHLDLCCKVCWDDCYIFLVTPSHDTNWSAMLHFCLAFLLLASCSLCDTAFLFTTTFPSQSVLHDFSNFARGIMIIIHPQGVASVEQVFRKLSTTAVTFGMSWEIRDESKMVSLPILTMKDHRWPECDFAQFESLCSEMWWFL